MNKIRGLLGSFARLGVGSQLRVAFAVVLTFTVLIGTVSLWSMAKEDERASELADKWLAGVGHLAQTRVSVIEMREMEVKHSRSSDKSYHAEYEGKMAESAKATDAGLAAYRAITAGEADAKLLAAVAKGWVDYEKFSKQVVALGRSKKQSDAADISDGAAAMALEETLGALSAISKFNFEGGQAAAASATATYRRARTQVMSLMALALVFSFAMAVMLKRGIIGQLGGEPRVAVSLARAVAEGDLTTPISVKPDDTTSLMASLSAMQQGLANAVRQVREGSESVATASAQIAQGNQDLSSRTEQQASALQQTAATMEELGATVRHNADSAKQANQLAQGASAVAAQGGQVVGKVVTTMQGINDSSRKIGDIISVIDGIAFQTNILALNAAVEAARAGEQGRGFAVVASEVRSLAQRSAEAAKEIKILIGRSVEQVEQGTLLVDHAGKTMGEIVGSIQRVSDIVAEITSASVEQNSSVQQVVEAVSQMDQATQQNAALVEECAAAAESLKGQAQQLVQAVAVFKLSPQHWQPGLAEVAAAPPAHHAPSVERRGPGRAKNVTRASFKSKPAAAAAGKTPAMASALAKTGSDDWASI